MTDQERIKELIDEVDQLTKENETLKKDNSVVCTNCCDMIKKQEALQEQVDKNGKEIEALNVLNAILLVAVVVLILLKWVFPSHDL